MKIYTKYGDKGFTRLYGGDRVSKTNIRVEAYGTTDEVCSLLGSTVAKMANYPELSDIREECITIQHHLFDCGSDLATPRELRPYKQTEKDVEWLEKRIDEYLPSLPQLQCFIIPGGSKVAAEFHILRTATRRLERKMVAVIEAGESINEEGLRYINRLSDYFFVVACLINVRMGIKEVDYVRSDKIFKLGNKK